MCESPIPIANKANYGNPLRNFDKSLKYPWKDFTSKTILVPCGHCKECIRMRQDSLVQRIQMESMKNHFFLCTLTYQNKYLPTLNVNDHTIRYADTHDVQCMLKMLRRDNAFGIPFRYLAVSELGSQRGRPHFHILFMFPKEYFSSDKKFYVGECDSFASKKKHYFTVLKYWRRNLGSRRSPEWVDLTCYVEKFVNGKIRKNYDFHYINPFLTKNGVEDCGYYVLKYMFKPSDRAVKLQQALALNLSPDEYINVWNKVRPRYFASVGFGFNAKVQLKQGIFERDPDIVDKVKSDILKSKESLNYPAYFNPFTGRAQFVSPYYLEYPGTYSYQDRMDFWKIKSLKSPDPIPGDLSVTPLSEFYSQTDIKNHKSRYEKTVKHVDDLGVDSDLDLLD